MNEEQQTFIQGVEHASQKEVIVKVTGREGIDLAPHNHNRVQLVEAVTGTLRVTVGDREYFVPEGYACWIPAGMTHALTSHNHRIALRIFYFQHNNKGDEADVVNCLSRATECVNYKELLGYAQISEGKYGAAAVSLKGVHTEGAALAQVLGGDYMGAAETLTLTPRDTGTNYYLRAIIAMRAGQPSLAPAMLTEAFKLDPSLRAKAAKDAEFYKLRDNAEFKKCLGV